MRRFDPLILTLAMAALTTSELAAQPPGGPGGPGGPGAPDIELVEEFDRNDDGRLNQQERAEARKSIQSQGGRRGGPGGGRGPRGPRLEPGSPGEKVAVDEAEVFGDRPLYDPNIVRTLFLTFENEDWEQELADFKPTDVEVPAKMIVDGKEYDDVGVSFRGASSFFMIPSGLKRSFNISMDHADEDQNLYGYRTLNLLNSNGDPSILSTILYSWIAGQKIATPKANYVKVVVNGENWGIYCNVEQFNSDFTKEHFDSKKGARWKVNGSPRGDGGLRYLGDDIEPYRTRFEIKSKDKEGSWRDLIELCKTLNETPADQLEEKLNPILDVDGALWFLAVDNALINSDGYWTRASDYNIYQDPKGRFHILPHDMNEAFRGARGGRGGGPGGGRGPGGGGPGGPGGGPGFGPPPGGPGGGPGFGPPPGEAGGRPQFGGRGGRGGRGEQGERGGRGDRGGRPEFGGPGGPGGGRGGPGGGPGGPGGDRNGLGNIALDPLVGLDDDSKPLRSKLLANEKLRTRYLQYVKEIASEMLDWEAIGTHVQRTRDLLTDEVKSDTRMLFTYDAFLAATSLDPVKEDEDVRSIRAFAEKRARYLLDLDEIKDLPSKSDSAKTTPASKERPSVAVSSLSRVSSPLSIREVMSNNKTTLADPQGKFDDWIELHNASDKAIDLSGFFLSDDEDHAHKWAFPKGTSIAPGGFLIVWADEDGGDKPGLHANFKLSQKGERVFLTDGQSVLSELSFPAQQPDQSFGVVDGSTKALKPSPGKANASAP